jgi:uncharacterized YkwD family protein
MTGGDLSVKHKFIVTIAAAAALSFTALTGAEAASVSSKPNATTSYKVIISGGFIKFPWGSVQLPSQGTDSGSNDAVEQNKPSTDAPTVEEDTSDSNSTESSDYEVSAYEQEVLELTNAERAKQGLEPLTLDTELSKVARIKSEDMQKNNYFSHTSPTYGSPFDMMKQFGISYRAAAENIAMGQRTPEEVVNAWMNSDGHRKNILSSSYTHIGIGYVENGNYWTQMFIGK